MILRFYHFDRRVNVSWWKIDKDRRTYDALDNKPENDNGCGLSGDIEDTTDSRADNNVSVSGGRNDERRMSWSEIAWVTFFQSRGQP